jgi:hypothetical protein
MARCLTGFYIILSVCCTALRGESYFATIAGRPMLQLYIFARFGPESNNDTGPLYDLSKIKFPCTRCNINDATLRSKSYSCTIAEVKIKYLNPNFKQLFMKIYIALFT